VPTVAMVAGMQVMFYYDDHAPPHFHVRGTQFVARIAIVDGSVLDVDGRMTVRETRILRKWSGLRRHELMSNWERARNSQPLHRIEGM
jgi:hypothetical protein